MQGLSTRKNHLSDISLLVCTWNVGNKCPDAAELEHWLPVNGEGYDIIVVGTQENAFSEKKSNRATIVSSADASSGRQKSVNLEEDEELHDEKSNRNTAKPDKEDHTLNAWEHMCLEHLGIGWAVLAHVVLREMRLTVYTTTALEETAVHNVVVASAATGLGGVIGNKGGLVARFSVGHTSLGFCSCHLAAHEGADYARQRNAMCRKVLVKTAGGKVGGFDRGPGRSLKTRHLDIAHSVDHLIWLGDLNYRTSSPSVPPTCAFSSPFAARSASSPASLPCHAHARAPPTTQTPSSSHLLALLPSAPRGPRVRLCDYLLQAST